MRQLRHSTLLIQESNYFSIMVEIENEKNILHVIEFSLINKLDNYLASKNVLCCFTLRICYDS